MGRRGVLPGTGAKYAENTQSSACSPGRLQRARPPSRWARPPCGLGGCGRCGADTLREGSGLLGGRVSRHTGARMLGPDGAALRARVVLAWHKKLWLSPPHGQRRDGTCAAAPWLRGACTLYGGRGSCLLARRARLRLGADSDVPLAATAAPLYPQRSASEAAPPSEESPGCLPAPWPSRHRGANAGTPLATPAGAVGRRAAGAPLTYFSVHGILATLCAAVGESRPPGCQDCAAPRELQVGVQPPARLRRHNTRPSCPTGTNWIEGARRCCVPCPAGKFLVRACLTNGSESVCDACPAGTFRAQPNTLPKCQACYECDRQAFQSVLSNCSATSNIACGCEPGRFRDCVDEHCSHFSCRQCQPCTGRLIQRPCTEVQDTLCGSCKPNFYAEGSECRPCHLSTPETCGKDCQRVCGSSSGGSGLEYLLLSLTGPLFLGALAIYHKRKRLQHGAPASSPVPVAQAASPTAGAAVAPGCQVSAQKQDGVCWPWPLSPQVMKHVTGTASWSPEQRALLWEQHSGAAQPPGEVQPSAPPEPHGALLQGSQLYAVIDAVPVRRWKEFMRVLELREAEIELVELEVTHIRDQQYEMLKRWCQQTSATLDRVFAALEHMDLAGCAEALRRSLPAGP
ncbi:tumor necrosis factor receptor superfamily member 25 [Phaenicophaeus curvirostris]|uniref:tumor necrosis factor receptor superfamily member 25 n=1 Tax=Phaenicophaeus curvirostris TaxID=33595 RepID=UPI0037F0C735